MKDIAELGSLDGNYTNHSGKRTCATSLYDANIDEQEIMDRTGHRSIAAVRKYKRQTENVRKRTSAALNPKVITADDKTDENKFTKCNIKEEKRCVLGDVTNIKSIKAEILNSVKPEIENTVQTEMHDENSNLKGFVFNSCTFNF
jgi:hypothetical protein